jgi:hypothetical protein
MKTIYEATKNSDQTEGRGQTVRIAAFSKVNDARRAAKGQGVMGYGDGDVQSLEVYDSFEEYEGVNKKTLRKRALAKLTPEEKEALEL